MLSRAQFLGATGGLLTSALARNAHDWDVIVVGAGASGLACGQRLQQQGRRVLIVEGRNRLGGRIWTDRSGSTALDLGASWIHGTQGNPLTALAAGAGIRTVPTDYDAISRYAPGGAPLTDKEQDDLDELYQEVMRQVEKARDASNGPDMPLSQGIARVADHMALSPWQRLELSYAVNTEIEHEYAADTSQLSFLHWDDGGQLGGPDVLFPHGYGQIVQILARGLTVRTGQVVRAVLHRPGAVTVVTQHGSFHGRHAVVTVPLGVVPHILFDPPLPVRIRIALSRLGMGLLNKTYLLFPHPFWPKDSQLLGYISQTHGEWAEWYTLQHLTGKPWLLGFNAATYARALEGRQDKAIVAGAMAVLRRIFGDTVPDPLAWRITRWGADPFARGSTHSSG